MTEAYQGKERRMPRTEPLSRDEFIEFKTTLDRRMDTQDQQLEAGRQMFEKLNTAMFAKDEINEFESPGVMTVMQKINRHVDMMCSFAQGVHRIGRLVMWAGGIAGALAAIKLALGSLG